jgi:Putative amidoligase enzyme
MRYTSSVESNINPNRKIGIEIEFVAPIIGTGTNRDVQELIANVLTQSGIQAVSRGYSRHPLPRGVQIAVEHDASLQDESKYRGLSWSKLEVKTSPMLWDEVESVLPKTLDIIRYVGARVNASCGLHVHHHFPEAQERPEVVRNLQHLWWRFHKVMYGVVAPSRQSHMYCRPPRIDDAKQFDNCRTYESLNRKLYREERYTGLNLSNLANPGRMTVEWRLHGGTTDWSKIRPWVLATQRWVEHSVKRSCHFKPEPVSNTQAGLNALLVTTGLRSNSRIYRKVDKDLRQVGKYLLQRWKQFNLPQNLKSAEAA